METSILIGLGGLALAVVGSYFSARLAVTEKVTRLEAELMDVKERLKNCKAIPSNIATMRAELKQIKETMKEHGEKLDTVARLETIIESALIPTLERFEKGLADLTRLVNKTK